MQPLRQANVGYLTPNDGAPHYLANPEAGSVLGTRRRQGSHGIRPHAVPRWGLVAKREKLVTRRTERLDTTVMVR